MTNWGIVLSKEEKIKQMMYFYGLSRKKAIEQLVDSGDIEE